MDSTTKVAVITGASKGIGLATATALAEGGYAIVAASRDPQAVRAELGDRFPVLAVAADLATPEGPAEVIRQAMAAWGRVDLLVNNVGALDPNARRRFSIGRRRGLAARSGDQLSEHGPRMPGRPCRS